MERMNMNRRDEDEMRIRYVRYVRKVAFIGEFNRTSDKLSTR
jgi:hypothetical protein